MLGGMPDEEHMAEIGELYVDTGTLYVEGGESVTVSALCNIGNVQVVASTDTLFLTVDQAMTLGNKLIDAARDVRRAAPIGAKGNE